MQAVHVLGHKGVQTTTPIQFDKGVVTDIGFYTVPEPTGHDPPVGLPDLGLGHVHVDVGRPLGLRVQGPYPLRSAKVGDSAIGRDSRTCQNGQWTGRGDQCGSGLHSCLEFRLLF